MEAIVLDEETIRLRGLKLKPGARLRVYREEGVIVLIERLPEGRRVELKPGERRRLAPDLVVEKSSDGRIILYVEAEARDA